MSRVQLIIDVLSKIYPGAKILTEYVIADRQRLDIYIPLLKLAVEHNGIQHSNHVKFFHKTKLDFLEAQKRDKNKAQYCRDHNISLVIIDYNEEITEDLIKEKIRKALNA